MNNKKEPSFENSMIAAEPIKKIMEAVKDLDVEYLTSALEEMKKNHSFKSSAAVLDPNPFTHIERQGLEAAKLEQLELMIKLAENYKTIYNQSVGLQRAELNSGAMSKMFGL